MRTKKAPAATGAGARVTLRAANVSHPHYTQKSAQLQPPHPNISQALDVALSAEEAHAEAGAQLLDEARRLARRGFRHLSQADTARRLRAALERAIPEGGGPR